jgi:hypothetical protein
MEYTHRTFVLGFFHLAQCFKVHPHGSVYQYLVIFYGWMIFHDMDMSLFVRPPICWWTSVWAAPICWLPWVVLPWMCVYTHTYIFFWAQVFCSLSIYLGMELLGHMVIFYISFWGIAKLLFTEAVPFYFPPTVSRCSLIRSHLIPGEFSSQHTYCKEENRTLICTLGTASALIYLKFFCFL